MAIKRCYCDTETTGTNPKLNGVIQWTAKITIDFKVVSEINLKLQPFKTDVIDDVALEHNRVKREDLFKPDRLTPEEGFKQIQAFLGKHCDKFNRTDKYFFHGFKAQFDADFTREFFIKNEDNYYGSYFWVPPCCIMSLAGHLLQKERTRLENFKLQTVFKYLFPNANYTEEAWHDALFDIDRTIEVEGALRKRITDPVTKYKNALRNIALDVRTPVAIAEELRELLQLEQAELPLK